MASSGGMVYEQCADCREISTGSLFALQLEVLDSRGIIGKEAAFFDDPGRGVESFKQSHVNTCVYLQRHSAPYLRLSEISW